jgi:hypothetical protein
MMGKKAGGINMKSYMFYELKLTVPSTLER